MTKQDSPSILIILTASLGDVVRGFAVLAPIKSLFPNSHITWLIEDKWKSIAENVQGIDEILVFERKKGWQGIKKIYQDLRKNHYDITLDMQRHFKSGCFSLLSGAKRRIGFHRANAHEFNFIFNNEFITKREENYPKIYQYMNFVDVLGGTWEEPLNFGFDTKNVVRENKIGVVLGSSTIKKDWNIDHYKTFLSRVLSETDQFIVLLGDSSQIPFAEEMLILFGSERLSSLVGKTTLPQLVTVLASCRVAVGPDSGPGHISAAVSTPYIALFGPTNIRRVGPYKMGSLALQAQSHIVSDISEDEVFEKLIYVLSGNYSF